MGVLNVPNGVGSYAPCCTPHVGDVSRATYQFRSLPRRKGYELTDASARAAKDCRTPLYTMVGPPAKIDAGADGEEMEDASNAEEEEIEGASNAEEEDDTPNLNLPPTSLRCFLDCTFYQCLLDCTQTTISCPCIPMPPPTSLPTSTYPQHHSSASYIVHSTSAY